MNILSANKTFKDVRVGEKIYVLDPKDQTIKEVTVTVSAPHPKSKNHQVWSLKAYMPFRLDSIKEEALAEAKKYGTNVEMEFLLNKDEVMCITMSTVPTVIATEKTYIEQWMKKSNSGLILPRRNR